MVHIAFSLSTLRRIVARVRRRRQSDVIVPSNVIDFPMDRVIDV